MTTENSKISIIGSETENHQVSIETMTQVLSGIQKTVYLLASAKHNYPLQKRFMPNREIKKSYTLTCGLPEAGSYVIPLSQVEQPTLIDGVSILDDLAVLFNAIAEASFDKLQTLLPDSRYREKVLREATRFLPKPGGNWGVSFQQGNRPLIALESKSVRTVENWLIQAEMQDTIMTVTGELIRIDFDKNLVTLRYPPTNRESECSYVEEIEDNIIESRRELIQVTGRFTLDAEGHPMRLVDVSRIESVDLSPMTFSVVEHSGRVLKLNPPLILEPDLDEDTQQLLIISDSELDLYVYAQTREVLADDLIAELFLLWDEYAQADDGELTDVALKLKAKLRVRMQEDTYAA